MGLENIRIVLKSPLYGGNVGSVCRAMANMGLSDLALAEPRALNMDEARMMACHATEILGGMASFPDLPASVADCTMVVGTSARGGLYRQHARTPREMAPLVLDGAAAGRVAFLFGPEDNGLTNDDLAICTHIVQIPTTMEFSSLNVAQAVMVCIYEIFVAQGSYTPIAEKSPVASVAMRERLFEIWRAMLLKVGFFGEDKADHMMLGFRRVFARGALTEDDMHILMGVAKQAAWAADRYTRRQKEQETRHG